MSETQHRDLILIHGKRKRFIRLQENTPVIIGRSPNADFFLNATSVSRKHCALTFKDGEIHAEDLGSRNSCFINEEKIKRGVLTDGIALQLGKISFKVEFIQTLMVTCNHCGFRFPPGEANDEGVVVCPQCWSVVEIKDTNNVWDGLEAEGFRVISLLSQEPQVFKAERVEIGKVYRVKVLPLREDQDPSVTEKFLKEARLAASLVHDNVFQVFDVRRAPGIIYVVMEFQEGKTLFDHIQEDGPFEFDKAMRLAHEVCDAIEYANERGIVHGNINPRIVFITKRGLSKLMDFSLSREMTALSGTFDIDPTQADDQIMAPEIYTAINQDAVDVRADFWGLGLILHFALSGHTAFPGVTGLEMAMKLSRGEYPKAEFSNIPGHLIPFLERLLASEPKNRPSTIKEIREELKSFQRSNAKDPLLDTVGADSAMFTGAISSNELVEFVQMVELHGKTGVLVVKSDSTRGTVKFRDGRIIDASDGAQDQGTAARSLLGLRQGRFSFTPQRPDQIKGGGVNLHVSALLMELAREQDESGIF